MSNSSKLIPFAAVIVLGGIGAYVFLNEGSVTGHAGGDPDTTTVNDPEYYKQLNMSRIGVEALGSDATGQGIVVAVLDTGVGTQGSDTPINLISGYNFIDNPQSADTEDYHGHGTHCAGTIAQATNNGYGVRGIAPEATILPVQVLSDSGPGTTLSVAQGITYAVDQGAHVISMSLGSSSSGGVYMQSAIQYALDNDVIVVAATGNNGYSNSISYPARFEGVIAVGSVGFDHQLAYYTNRGPGITFTSYGGDYTQDVNGDGQSDLIAQETIKNGQYDIYGFQGTSMATPHVAGVFAALLSTGRSTTDVLEAVMETVEDEGDPGWDKDYGYGVVNLAAAYEYLQDNSDDGGSNPPDGDTGNETVGLTTIESNGATTLLESSSSLIEEGYFINDSSTRVQDGNGNPVSPNTYAGWDAVSVEASGSNYLLAWTGPNSTFQVWTLDSTGRYTSTTGVISASQIRGYENTFSQDIDGDGSIGVVATTIESNGDTSLSSDGSSYYISTDVSTLNISYNGTIVGPNTYAGWSIIGAEASGSNYLAACAGPNSTYQIWTLNSSGSYISGSGVITASQVLDYEDAFSQDLNGDGAVGSDDGGSDDGGSDDGGSDDGGSDDGLTTIESDGSTTLKTDGSVYIISPADINITYSGTPVGPNTYSGWTVIGAEASGSNYLAACAGPNSTYQIWTLNSSGSYISGSGVITASQLLDYEDAFSQDLDGDGAVGSDDGGSDDGGSDDGGSDDGGSDDGGSDDGLTTIESDGSTTLKTDGSVYIISPANINVTYSGTPVGPNTYSGWTVIGAEASGSNYLAACAGPNSTYQIWTLNSSGSYVSGSGVITASQLLDYEDAFSQDLDGDGAVGSDDGGSDDGGSDDGGSDDGGSDDGGSDDGGSDDGLTTIESDGSTTLKTDGSVYIISPANINISYSGTNVGPNTYSGWTMFGVEASGSSYLVACAGPNSTYQIWTLNSSGSYISGSGVITASQLLDYEDAFSQDLNGDGAVGSDDGGSDDGGSDDGGSDDGGSDDGGSDDGGSDDGGSDDGLTTIESDGSTTLKTDGSVYIISPANINVTFSGTTVGPSTYAGWTVFGVEASGNNYLLACAGPNSTYQIWTLNSSGSYVSGSGVITASQLSAYEEAFSQDLDGDGAGGSDDGGSDDGGSDDGGSDDGGSDDGGSDDGLTTIESDGSTTLKTDGSVYIISPANINVTYSGTPVGPSTYAGWTVFGVEASGNNYLLACAGPNSTYQIWTLNSSGGYVSGSGVITANHLSAYEEAFSQDLNGDGVGGSSN